MRLRRTTLLISAATLLASVSAFYLLTSSVLRRGFSQLQDQHVRKTVERVLEMLANEVSKLEINAADYAESDETCAMMAGTPNASGAARFADQELARSRINLVLLLDPDGNVVYQKALDLDTGRPVGIPATASGASLADGVAQAFSATRAAPTGIVSIADRPMLVASRTILDSRASGPARGTLLFGRYLDLRELTRLSRIAQCPIVIAREPESHANSALSALEPGLNSAAQIVVGPVSEQSVAGLARIPDALGQPGLLLTVTMDANIVAQGHVIIRNYLVPLISACLLFGGLTMLLFEKQVLSRFGRLSAGVNRIAASQGVSGRLTLEGRDELSDLAGTINGMLDTLERARLARIEGEERFRMMADAAPVMIWTCGVDALCTYVSQGWLNFTGRTQEQELGNGWVAGLHPLDAQRSLELLAESIRDRRSFSMECRVLRHDGQYRWVLSQGVPRFTPDGTFTGFIGSCTDITERERMHAELRHSQQQLFDFFENAPIGSRWVGPDGIIMRANQAELDLLGYARNEYVGRHINEFHADSDVIDDILARLKSGETLVGHEARLRCKDGSIKHVLIDSNVLWSNGEFIHTRWFTRDISDRKRADEALRASKEYSDNLIDSSLDMIVSVDLDQNITLFNAAAEQAFGYPRHEIVGSPVAILYARPELGSEIHREIQKSGNFSGEVLNKRRNGQRFYAYLSASVLRDSNGRAVGVMGISRDITERKRTDAELRITKDAAEAANRELATINRRLESAIEQANRMTLAAETASNAKSAFLANMSHEIRTPMTAILGFTDQLLEVEPEHDEKLDALNTIRRNGEHLLRIINDILDLSKIEAGRLIVEPMDCDPMQLIRETLSFMRVRSDAKQLRLEAIFEGPIPQIIRTDPTRLRQILINLTGNAIKFTEKGCVRIEVSLLAPGLDHPDIVEPMLRLNIVDDGMGMDSEQTARLFQPFSQADASTTRRFGGTGLGLTISRRLAVFLGGDITVASRPGLGSTFTVTITTGPLTNVKLLNVAPDANVEVVPYVEPVTAQSPPGLFLLAGCRILLAEDGVDNQRLISLILGRAGARVETANNGRAAVDLALASASEGRPYDAILMDMQMPELDGYSATRLLRRHGYSAPIVALTAHAMDGDREKCLAAGCDEYSTKPIDRKTLIELIHRHTKGAQTVAS